VLSADMPWDYNNLWSTFAAYFFILHIPLSFGGLSITAHILHQSVLDPLTMVSTCTLNWYYAFRLLSNEKYLDENI